jgi:hypothetical protein
MTPNVITIAIRSLKGPCVFPSPFDFSLEKNTPMKIITNSFKFLARS